MTLAPVEVANSSNSTMQSAALHWAKALSCLLMSLLSCAQMYTIKMKFIMLVASPSPAVWTKPCMIWYSKVKRPTRHIIGHFGDDFMGQVTQPTVSQHWRTVVSQPGQAPIQRGWAHKKVKCTSHLRCGQVEVMYLTMAHCITYVSAYSCTTTIPVLPLSMHWTSQ